MIRSAFLATLVAGVASTVQVSAQAPPTPPDHYALTNARIVTAPGRVIERGTIVMRDGRITAVGPQVAIPTAAIQVDATGHTVYAGLIDAASSVGLPSLVRQGGFGGGGRGGTASDMDQEVMPAREAADVWTPSDADLATLRAAGITTAGLAFNGGIFPGRVAAVHTGGGESAVLRAGIAQQVLLGRRRGEYPGTLMGSIAYVKQSFYDAQHGMRVRQAWERQPTGPRPDYSAELRALEPAASGALPVWFVASSERDLHRIVELAGAVGVTNYAIVGAAEGWRALDLLRGAARPVIVSLDFPDADQISGRAFDLHVAPVSGEDEARERADSAAVLEGRGNPAALFRAGVQIALSTHGMSSPAKLRSHVKAAIDAGLVRDEALRALTVTPARLLGIESVAGTIEPGKLANLVVVAGDIFDPDARIRDVFVEGVRHEIPAPEPRTERGDSATDRAVVSGEWVGEMEGPNGLMQFTLTIRGAGAQLTGSLASEMGAVELTGSQNGADITLSGTWSPPGMNALAVSLTGRVTGDDLNGTVTAQGISPVPFTARRRGPGASQHEVMR